MTDEICGSCELRAVDELGSLGGGNGNGEFPGELEFIPIPMPIPMPEPPAMLLLYMLLSGMKADDALGSPMGDMGDPMPPGGDMSDLTSS